MKVSPNSFLSVLETGLVPISELRRRQKGVTDAANLVAIIFSATGIAIEYDSPTLCFVTQISTDSPTTMLTQTRIQVHLKDLVNLLRCCCESNDAVEVSESDQIVFFKSGQNFEAEIQGVFSTSGFEKIDFGDPIVGFFCDSDILFSAFHQFLISPIPQKIVLCLNSRLVITNTESDQAEYPLCTRVEIGRQFLTDFIGQDITCTISGQNISSICSFLSVERKIKVEVSSGSWLTFSHNENKLGVYVSSL